MLPFIVGGRDCVEFYPVEGELKVGDIVMARVEEGYPVVHRIIGIEPVAGAASPASFSADDCRTVAYWLKETISGINFKLTFSDM